MSARLGSPIHRPADARDHETSLQQALPKKPPAPQFALLSAHRLLPSQRGLACETAAENSQRGPNMGRTIIALALALALPACGDGTEAKLDKCKADMKADLQRAIDMARQEAEKQI